MKRLVLAAFAASTLVLAGCSTSTADGPRLGAVERPTPTTVSPTPTPEPTPDGCDPAPFTGLADAGADPEPVIAVKVENSYNARPQTGLEDADVVVVEMVEGGENRFMAIYNSTVPDVVGPVRSLRPMDAAILGQWSSPHLYYSGGQARFVTQVQNAGVVLHVDGDTGFYRDSSRYPPHNLYLSLSDAAAGLEAPSDCLASVFEFLDEDDDDAPSAKSGASDTADSTADTAQADAAVGTPVTSVTVAYPSVTSGWDWNGTAWERSDNGSQNISASSGQVLTATNVLVLRVTTQDTGTYDAAGASVPETILVGSGEVTLFRDGQSFHGTWSKAGTNDPLVFTADSGEALELSPGNTWIELLPTQGSLSAS